MTTALDTPMTIRDALTLVELVRATRPRHPLDAVEDALLDLAAKVGASA